MVPKPTSFALRRDFSCKVCVNLGVHFRELHHRGVYVFTRHLIEEHCMSLYEYWSAEVEPFNVPW